MVLVVCTSSRRGREDTEAHLRRYGQAFGMDPPEVLCFADADAMLAHPRVHKAGLVLMEPFADAEGAPCWVPALRGLRRLGFGGPLVLLVDRPGTHTPRQRLVYCMPAGLAYGPFCAALQELRLFGRAAPRAFVVPEGGHNRQLHTDEVFWAQKDGRGSLLQLEAGQVQTPLSLGGLRQILGDEGFVACGRRRLVNLDHVKRLGKGCFVMPGGQRLPIPPRARRECRRRYLAYRNARFGVGWQNGAPGGPGE